MNKYQLFGLLLFFLILVTYIVDVTAVYTVTGGVDTELAGVDSFSPGSVGSLVDTFFDLMFFRVVGLPTIANLLLFYPIAGMTFFMGIDIAKDLIPFT